ncbi:hypothetical protein ACHAXT_011409 [Thalassiosira profunda]
MPPSNEDAAKFPDGAADGALDAPAPEDSVAVAGAKDGDGATGVPTPGRKRRFVGDCVEVAQAPAQGGDPAAGKLKLGGGVDETRPASERKDPPNSGEGGGSDHHAAAPSGLKLGSGDDRKPAPSSESKDPAAGAPPNPGKGEGSGHPAAAPSGMQGAGYLPPGTNAAGAASGIANANQPQKMPAADAAKKVRHKAERLMLLRHVAKCTNNRCTAFRRCADMKAVWKHVTSCREKSCSFKHCNSSRHVLSHFRKCKDVSCAICAPTRQMARNGGMSASWLEYKAPAVKPLPPGVFGGTDIEAADSVCRPTDSKEMSNNMECKICLDKLAPDTNHTDISPVTLKACGHIFHVCCIRESMRHQSSLKCPECGTSVLLTADDHFAYQRGNMPSAEMACVISPTITCAGYEGCGSIVIEYRIAAAMQQAYHPNPGQRFTGTKRQAFLPDNEEGRALLARLKAAFLCGLTFTVGTSLTTNRENSVTWASIHHKTSPTGGTLRHGFPDPNYLTNCNEELNRAGVPPAKACADYVVKFGLHATPSGGPILDRCFYKEDVNSLLDNESDENPLSHLASVFKRLYSKDFTDFVESSGLKSPKVEVNPHLLKSGLYAPFVEEGKRLCAASSKEGDKGSDDHVVRIVFHGTSEANVESILCNGLDPSLRKGQAHGQGEYFANRPELPISYCRGGKAMVVFAVITTSSELRVRDIVVVTECNRQLPIATLSFDGFDPFVVTAADRFQARVAQHWKDVQEKEKRAKETQTKEKIVRLLLAGEYLAASDIYQKACDDKGMPPESFAQEIATYVWDHVRDEEMVMQYFPNLPARPAKSDEVKILSVAKCESEAKAAKRKYEEMAQKKPK